MDRKVKVAVIGVGGRGLGMIQSVISKFADVEITAVCDLYPERVEKAIAEVEQRVGNTPYGSADYNEILKRDDVEAVYIATSWESHVEIAIAAQKAGKATGLEVGELSAPVAGNRGVYVLQVVKENVASRPYDESAEMTRLEQQYMSAVNQFMEVLKDKAEIKNTLVRFF